MKCLLLGAMTLLSALSFGQSKKFTFKLGDEYELPRRTIDLAFFGNDKDGIVNLSQKKDQLTILRFDPVTLAQTSDKVIELPDASKYFASEGVADFGANYFWLHSDWNKSDEKELFYYDKIDVVTGKVISANQLMFETTEMGSNINKYVLNYSADHKKLLVSYRLKPEKKKDKDNFDKLGLQVFDENMKKIWGSEFTMPYNEAVMDNSDFSLDSKGNGYLLAKVYDSEKRREKDKETGMPAYHYEVLKFSPDSKKIISATISLDNFFIHQATLVESSTNDMIISCTYSKKAGRKGNSNGTDGIFLATLDQSGKVVKFKDGYYEFPLDELTKFESARAKKKMEKKDDYEAPNLSVRYVSVEADGSVFMACEEYYTVVTTTYNGRYTTTYTTYYYEDIIAAKINVSGKFEWLRKIPKKQRGLNGIGTMSFKLISDASGYYFLFLDNKKNMELAEDEVPKYHVDPSGGQVVVVKLDPSGTMTKELLFDVRDEDVIIYPSQFSKINGHQFIGRARVKRNHYKPLLITAN